MQIIFWICAGLMILSGLALIVSILMQSGKAAGLSGSIGGGAEQLFGKTKSKSLDSMFERLTLISAVTFMLCAVVMTIVQKFM